MIKGYSLIIYENIIKYNKKLDIGGTHINIIYIFWILFRKYFQISDVYSDSELIYFFNKIVLIKSLGIYQITITDLINIPSSLDYTNRQQVYQARYNNIIDYTDQFDHFNILDDIFDPNNTCSNIFDKYFITKDDINYKLVDSVNNISLLPIILRDYLILPITADSHAICIYVKHIDSNIDNYDCNIYIINTGFLGTVSKILTDQINDFIMLLNQYHYENNIIFKSDIHNYNEFRRRYNIVFNKYNLTTVLNNTAYLSKSFNLNVRYLYYIAYLDLIQKCK